MVLPTDKPLWCRGGMLRGCGFLVLSCGDTEHCSRTERCRGALACGPTKCPGWTMNIVITGCEIVNVGLGVPWFKGMGMWVRRGRYQTGTTSSTVGGSSMVEPTIQKVNQILQLTISGKLHVVQPPNH
jgi:hypothetical protein